MQRRESPAQAVAATMEELALAAGARMQLAVQKGHHRDVTHKGRVDLVTRVDREVQDFLLEEIASRFEGERVVAEEDDADGGDAQDGPTWYVDPIDGTTNFVYSHPFYCVSLARWDPRGRSVGVVFAPALDEIFVGIEGEGAWSRRPGQGSPTVPLKASAASGLDQALLATGFPYHRGSTARLNLALAAHALSRCRGLRRAGSAALDLCYVAAGRLDGYWELALKPWDIGAGTIIAREAGATVTDFTGDPRVLRAQRVCAAGPALHPELLAMIEAGHRAPELDPLGPALPAPVPLDGPLPTDLAGGA